jgi:tRNA(Ile)-lysidine synthetase-like protein
MADTRRLTALVSRIEPRLRLPEGDLVVGLSGGADSAALAHVLSRGGRTVRALHVHHGLAYSDRLEAAAREIGESLGLPVETVRVTVEPGSSPEGRARTARYKAFRESAAGEKVVLAHTRDDQAETVVMNLLRGAGLRGLAGIPWFRPPNVYRPMLDVTRSETREVAALAGLEYFDDPMNDAPELTRNAVRLEVLPMLGRFNPRLVASLARMAETVGVESAFLDRQAGSVDVMHDVHRGKVAVGELVTVDRALANRVLSGIVGRFREHPGLSSEEMDRVWRVARGESSREELQAGLVVTRSGPLLFVGIERGDFPPLLEVPLVPGRHELGRAVLEVQRIDSICQVAPLGTSWAIFDPGASLVARESDTGLVVEADGDLAWVPFVKRYPVAWYEPATTGYLSVLATEESGWTSSR